MQKSPINMKRSPVDMLKSPVDMQKSPVDSMCSVSSLLLRVLCHFTGFARLV